MNFLIMRGEYPFDDVVDVVVADTADAALAEAIKKNKTSNDVFLRHPVVEPVEGGSSLFYKES